MFPLSFAGETFWTDEAPALYWPAQNALIVADLHLEKASFFAGKGQMLPPYDSLATLERLAMLARWHDVSRIFCLGDNFHDSAGEARLTGSAATLLAELTGRYDWLWITGNHDPLIGASWGGRCLDQWSCGALVLRHQAEPEEGKAELSGHFHPRIRLPTRTGRTLWRRCYVRSETKLVLPAFGALTGGLDVMDAAWAPVLNGGAAEALVPLSQRLARFALPAIAQTDGKQRAFS